MDRGTGVRGGDRPACYCGCNGSPTVNDAPAGPLGANWREPSNVARTRQRPSDGGVNAIAAPPPLARRDEARVELPARQRVEALDVDRHRARARPGDTPTRDRHRRCPAATVALRSPFIEHAWSCVIVRVSRESV